MNKKDFRALDLLRLQDCRDTVNQWMNRYGVIFGVYKKNVFHERLFPFDSIPRVIEARDWERLERGLIQRVQALNAFLYDIYHAKNIIKDGIIPEAFVYGSKGYLPQCEGITPSKRIYSHISGIDLVQAKSGEWVILEDNLRIPSGASYPMIARTITRKVMPEIFHTLSVQDNRGYAQMLRTMFDYVNDGRGLNVILTPGRYNSAFFEHSYLAEKTGAVLAFPGDMVVEDGKVYYTGLFKQKQRVGMIYHRISDDYLDPLVFEASSLLGVPNLYSAYAQNNVAVVNAWGNGVADDKGIYYFVPKMIRYYLDEDPILANAPTYLPYYEKDRAFVLERLNRLVLKEVSEAGGYGVVFGKNLSQAELAHLHDEIAAHPRNWIAQEEVDFRDLDVLLPDGSTQPRKADLRAFVISGQKTAVWPSGLTRFSSNPESAVVNSSQGGGFDATWVLNSNADNFS